MLRTVALTLVALVAFAANSILCRLALRSGSIDAASFTAVRFFSGAVILAILTRFRMRGGSATSGVVLAIYALPFSLAYVRLDASTGALILFACVQLTMFGWSVWKGQRPSIAEWLGLALAAAGVAWLNLPGLSRPDPIGGALMAVAGAAWGAYSIRGRGVSDPLQANAKNFAIALPMVALAPLVSIGLAEAHANERGLELAVASGALASGLGYVIWYSALRGLSAAQAGIAQLAVPIIAATGGFLLLHETLSSRFAIAAALIISGIGISIYGKV